MYKVSIRPLSVAASPTEVIAESYLQVMVILSRMRASFDSTYGKLGKTAVEFEDNEDILMGWAPTKDEEFTPVLVVNIDELPEEPDHSQQPTLA